VQIAAKIYLAPGRHPVISAIAPELASGYAHILTEPLPENLAALLQQLDAKLSAEPANLAPANGYVGRMNAISHRINGEQNSPASPRGRKLPGGLSKRA
jgi:hypothetical protein